MRRLAAAGLAVALTATLTGCTLVTTLASGGSTPTPTATPGVTWSGDETPPPPPTTTVADSDDDESPAPTWVDAEPVAVALGETNVIEGRAGNQVGTFSFDSVTIGFDACTEDDFTGTEYGSIIEIAVTVTADDALAGEDDSWDYPQVFEMYLINAEPPGGSILNSTLGYDCVGINGWIDDIEPGQTASGSIYLDVEPADSYLVSWVYGHQRFEMPYPA